MNESALGKIFRTYGNISQDDVCSALEELGYQFDRNSRHGRFYWCRELAEHPDLAVRTKFAYFDVPNRDEVRRYTIRNVREAARLLGRAPEAGE